MKIEYFPFAHYSILDGKVVNVSLDAVSDEKRGLLYQTRILLDRDWIGVQGRRVQLVQGMVVTEGVTAGD